MLDVMHVDVTRIAAARESATLVARGEQAPQRGGGEACLAANIERLSAIIFYQRDDAGIAGEAARVISQQPAAPSRRFRRGAR
jgi:hypothetical protein